MTHKNGGRITIFYDDIRSLFLFYCTSNLREMECLKTYTYCNKPGFLKFIYLHYGIMLYAIASSLAPLALDDTVFLRRKLEQKNVRKKRAGHMHDFS